MTATDRAILDSWGPTLRRWASGFDLTTADGRADFRVRVARETAGTRVAFLREIATDQGAGTVPTTRGGAQRTLADVVINRLLVERRGGTIVGGLVQYRGGVR